MEQNKTPILFPYDPEKFWELLQKIIRQELSTLSEKNATPPEFEVSGMTYKPLYKISEVCSIFQITRPTVYDWVKHGKLTPYKIRSRVYFLWNDIQALLSK